MAYCEPVKFGDGKAVEVRNLTRMLIYAHIAGLVSAPMRVSPPPDNAPDKVTKMVAFVDDSLRALGEVCQSQWLCVCSDLEMLTPIPAESLEEKCKETFGSRSAEVTPYDAESTIRAEAGDGVLRQRCWMLDLHSGRVFCVRFAFAAPIYQGTVLGGSLTPADELSCAQFHIKQPLSWCGSRITPSASASPAGRKWIHQQLNAWFCTPTSADCWFRPNRDADAFEFRLDLVVPPQTEEPTDATLPLLATDGSKWVDSHRIEEVRVFRLYLTQYPFIYTIMPDDDSRVNELKDKLKTSKDSDTQLQPLLLTIPTTECEQFVRATFRRSPKHKYLRWQCARCSGAALNAWIPIRPLL